MGEQPGRWPRFASAIGLTAVLVVGCTSAVPPAEPSSPPATVVASSNAPTNAPPSTNAPPVTLRPPPSRPVPPATSGAQTAPTSTVASTPAGTPSKYRAAYEKAKLVHPSDFPGLVTAFGFTTPSGNIMCGFLDDNGPGVTCQIVKFTYDPGKGDCRGMGVWGAAITMVDGKSPTFICAGDVESGGRELPYGSRIEVDESGCMSQSDGVTCFDLSTGVGFHLSKGGYEFF